MGTITQDSMGFEVLKQTWKPNKAIHRLLPFVERGVIAASKIFGRTYYLYIPMYPIYTRISPKELKISFHVVLGEVWGSFWLRVNASSLSCPALTRLKVLGVGFKGSELGLGCRDSWSKGFVGMGFRGKRVGVEGV